MSFMDESPPEPLPARAEPVTVRLARSLRMLKERFGKQYGQGPEVQLWHALDDLERMASSPLPALRDEQACRLWECIEAVTLAGAEVRLRFGKVAVIRNGVQPLRVDRPKLRDAAAHALGAVVMELDAAERERQELRESLASDREPLLSSERDARPEERP